MGKLKQLIADASRGTSAIQQNYSEAFPTSIAGECGPSEVEDMLGALDALSMAREEHDASDESWDGDASDDLWRAQMRYAGLLDLVASRFPLDVARAFEVRKGIRASGSRTHSRSILRVAASSRAGRKYGTSGGRGQRPSS